MLNVVFFTSSSDETVVTLIVKCRMRQSRVFRLLINNVTIFDSLKFEIRTIHRSLFLQLICCPAAPVAKGKRSQNQIDMF